MECLKLALCKDLLFAQFARSICFFLQSIPVSTVELCLMQGGVSCFISHSADKLQILLINSKFIISSYLSA